MGMTNPKPVRSDMLMGRNRLGARFATIRLKSAIDIESVINIQKYGLILRVNLFVIMVGKIIPAGCVAD